MESGATERGVMNRVREGATAQLSAQKDRATEGLGSVAQAVRQSAQPLRDNKQDVLAQYVEKAADQLEKFSNTLRNRDMGDLMNDAQRFARRQPALFIAGAFAVGLVGARFLKSSSENQRRQSWKQNYGSSSSFPGGYGSTRPVGDTTVRGFGESRPGEL
jgi:hypothetical protein